MELVLVEFQYDESIGRDTYEPRDSSYWNSTRANFEWGEWVLSVIGGTMNHMIFLLAAADTFLCRPMRLKIWDQNPKS